VEILAAGDDRLTPSEMTDELGALLPDARTTRLSGGGHLAPQSEPAAFTAALLEALSRLSSRLPPA
jgi:pimeloyl-ACP methyl ester carboxylesterase